MASPAYRTMLSEFSENPALLNDMTESKTPCHSAVPQSW